MRSALALVLLLALAAATRLAIVGEIAVGQPQWFWRADLFQRAVLSGEFERTLLAPHPGLTVLWAAGLAQHWFGAEGRFEQALASSWAIAILNLAILAVLLFLLLRRTSRDGAMLARTTALAAGWILTFDAILIHMSALVGLDGLVSLLMGAALVATFHAIREPGRSMTALAVVLTGLAVATKGAALALLFAPWLAALTLPGVVGRWRRGATTTAWMLVSSIVTVSILLPATWVAPWRVLNRLVLGNWGTKESLIGVLRMSRSETLLGNPEAPGYLVYGAHLVFRLAPAACVGLALGLAVRRFRSAPLARYLAAFALLFFAILSWVPQKEWRYLMPLLVLIDLLAGLGAAWFVLAPERSARRLRRAALVLALLTAQALWSLSRRPFYEFAMNPLVGGLPVAARAIPVGWGSGLERAAEFLADEANRRRHVISWTGGYGFSGFRDRKGLEFESPDTAWISPRVRDPDPECHVIYSRNPPKRREWRRRQWQEKAELAYRLEIDGVTITEVWCKPNGTTATFEPARPGSGSAADTGEAVETE